MDLITNPYSPLFNYTDPDDDLVIDREELISIDREELHFPFNMRNKPMLTSFQLSNISDKHVAFRVKTTNLSKYSIQPKKGILLPQSQTNVTVAMQAFKVEPYILECYDKFLVQSVAAPAGATVENITPEMFDKDAGFHVQEFKLTADFDVPTDLEGVYSEEEEEEEETSENATAASTGFSDHQITPTKFNKEAGIHVEECKLGAAYVAPPVPEASEEETSENDTSVFADRQIAEVKDLLSAFTNEKLSIIQANERLQDKLLKDIMSVLSKEKQPIIQEITSSLKEQVDFFKRGPRRISGGGGVSIYYVLLLVVLGILLVHIVSSLVSLDFS